MTPAARVSSCVSFRSSRSGPTNAPAAPPSSTALGGRRSSQVEQLAQRRAERQLVEPRPVDAAGDAEEPGAGRAFGPGLRVLGTAVSQHLEHVEERLDVVHGGGLPEEADFDGERRLVARLAAVALDRLEERGLLAADVGACADPQFDLEPVEVWAALRDRVSDPLVGERVLGPHVDERLRGAGRESRDRDRLDEGERIALHQHAVLERARLRLVGVADDVVRLSRLSGDRLPLDARRKGRAAAAEQVGVLELPDHGLGAELARPPQLLEPTGRDVGVERGRIDARRRSGEAGAGTGRPPGAAAGQPRAVAARAARRRRSCDRRRARARRARGRDSRARRARPALPSSAHDRSVQTWVRSAGRSSSARSA